MRVYKNRYIVLFLQKKLLCKRDNMTNLELIINMLAEATTTELSTKNNPQNLQESAIIAHKGASVAKNARLEIEQQGGEVITSQNAKQLGKRDESNKKLT